MLRKFQAIVLPGTAAMAGLPCSAREMAAAIGPIAPVSFVALARIASSEMSSAFGSSRP
jgi:hypothetical protein